ncbi:MAG: hypothetical protein KAW40_02570 [Candidatus Aenigmarchaeota archaeon]|nr:hypothetical protein [Candidatus Aenigmarchaeota archaeon]
MRLPLKVFILAFFSILLSVIPHTALAQNVTALQVSAPSSVEMDDNFKVTAYYTSNGTNICGATCRVEGGWLSSPVYLYEGSGCIYENTIYAYSTPGAYSLSLYCYKQYYQSQTEYFIIDITEKSSSLYILIDPSFPFPGDPVTVYAYYRDGSNFLIQGALCTATLKKGGVYFQSTTLAPFGSSYYSGTFNVPDQDGTYDVEVMCTSSEHDTRWSTESFTTSKKRASLSMSIPSSGYYGKFVKVVAYYEDEWGGKIYGACSVSFDGKISVLSSTTFGYEGGINIPYRAGTHPVNVTCESNEYETLETSLVISATNKPARIEVVSPPKGAVFYPTDEIPLKISYQDELSWNIIFGASCFAEVEGKSHPMTESGEYYVTGISNQPIGQQNIQFTCSKTFYEGTESSIQVSIVRIPIDIILTSQKTDFHGEEEIKILARVVDKRHNDVNADCRARADVYDLSFNRLVKSFDIPDMEVSEGSRVLDIPNPGEPSRIRVTVTCFGDILEEKSVYTEVKIKMLGRQIEEGMILFLTVTTVTLLALTFLIRKKLKII